MDRDAFYMRRACRLAERALGNTTPNPIVGAVIVKDGVILGEGFHTKAGNPHAEVEAIHAAHGRSSTQPTIRGRGAATVCARSGVADTKSELA